MPLAWSAILQILWKAKPRKKRTMLYPTVAAALKFQKDDYLYSAEAGLQELHNKEVWRFIMNAPHANSYLRYLLIC